jgi:hypothetical protein
VEGHDLSQDEWNDLNSPEMCLIYHRVCVRCFVIRNWIYGLVSEELVNKVQCEGHVWTSIMAYLHVNHNYVFSHGEPTGVFSFSDDAGLLTRRPISGSRVAALSDASCAFTCFVTREKPDSTRLGVEHAFAHGSPAPCQRACPTTHPGGRPFRV